MGPIDRRWGTAGTAEGDALQGDGEYTVSTDRIDDRAA